MTSSATRPGLRGLGAALLLIAVLATSCASSADTTVTAQAPSAEPEQVVATVEPQAAAEQTDPVAMPTPAPSPTPMPIPSPTPLFGPEGRPTSVGETRVLLASSSVARQPVVYDAPEGNPIPITYTYLSGRTIRFDHFTNPTPLGGNALSALVVEGEEGDDWAMIEIPTRPPQRAWIPTEGWSWTTSNFYVQVNVGDNTVKVWDDETLIADTAVVTGDTGRRTPIATTWIDDILPGPSGAYGPWLMSLAVFSDSLDSFGGGLPKTALHGTNRPDLLGQYASNGCIRLPNDVITLLADVVPVGTRVDIINEA